MGTRIILLAWALWTKGHSGWEWQEDLLLLEKEELPGGDLLPLKCSKRLNESLFRQDSELDGTLRLFLFQEIEFDTLGGPAILGSLYTPDKKKSLGQGFWWKLSQVPARMGSGSWQPRG